ncbi:hypothetical protein AB0F11_14145 [Streptomyces sp. NPDC032472]|uniref:hypothetical protein n=1 Tax=Streptomyces sp. NPDC032472 TaxID=3155018 RepID=UPI0033C80539
MADVLCWSGINEVESRLVSAESARRRRQPSPAAGFETPHDDAMAAWSQPIAPVPELPDLDFVARQYPDRKLTLDSRRAPLEFYGRPGEPNAFSLDSLEFFFLIAQYFREALPLRLILLLIACQRAGGRIHLTQEEMATVLDVHRVKAAETLREVMGHGIVFKVQRGVYQFNPPYSYRVAEFIPGTETIEAEYVKVPQGKTIASIRANKDLPDLVRFPSLEHMRQAIEELRKQRAEERAQRRLRKARQRQEGADQ